MLCDLCDREKREVEDLPIVNSQPLHFCHSCLIEQRMFCPVHRQVHLGFDDGTHVCLTCLVVEGARSEDRALYFAERLQDNLPPARFGELWVEAVIACLQEDAPPEFGVYSFIVLAAHRFGLTLEGVVDRVIEEQDIDMLLVGGTIRDVEERSVN